MLALQYNVTLPQAAALKTMGAFNHRLYYRGPLATVRLTEVPEPRLPTPQWVKIKTRCCGFCASDASMIFLQESPVASPFTSLPSILGHEVAGEVVETGSEVSTAAVGDRVTVAPHLGCRAREIRPVCPACGAGRPANCANAARGRLAPGIFNFLSSDVGGGFAPRCLAHESQLFRLPDALTDEEGALIEPLAVALQAVLDNLPQDGENTLIIGGGVIGSLVLQSLRALNIEAPITVIEPSATTAENLRQLGADHIISGKDVIPQAAAITGGTCYTPLIGESLLTGGFARIFDTIGATRTVKTALRCLAFGGTLQLIGIKPRVVFDPTLLYLKHQRLGATFAYGYNTVEGRREHTFETAIRLAAEGRVKLRQMVTHIFPLQQYRDMIAINRDKARYDAMKTMLCWNEAKGETA